MKRKDLLGLKDLSRDELEEILTAAEKMRKTIEQGTRKLPNLQNKSVVTLFYENSTRTRTSFETAAKILGAATTSINVATSSVSKGETLVDTGKNLDAILVNAIVIRHSMAGAPHLLAKNVRASVINAGDGCNEHPTQALLDMLTIKQKFGSFQGLQVAIVGDIKHSRVARSNIWGLRTMDAEVSVCAPRTLLPAEIEKTGARVYTNADECVRGANVVMGLRMQLERQQAGLFPSVAEYNALYGIDAARLLRADSDAIVMHPGPVNRGVEMNSDVIDGDQSVILPQVTNGVAVRMALLDLLVGNKA